MFALDTNAVSALFEGDEALASLLSADDRHALPALVVGEYRYGLLRSRHRKRLEALLDDLLRESELLVVDDETARRYAEVREALRKRGRPLPENDVWIAALALQHHLDLVSQDGDFDAVAGLVRRGW
jgi:tRNA(fMet)-specific endonuclease VapC